MKDDYSNIDADELDVLIVHRGPEHEPADTPESVNADFGSHPVPPQSNYL